DRTAAGAGSRRVRSRRYGASIAAGGGGVRSVPRAAQTKRPGKTRAVRDARWPEASGRQQRAHLLHGIRLDLADALGGDAVLVGQLLQRHLALVVQPAAGDDVARTRIQAGEAVAQQVELVALAVLAL